MMYSKREAKEYARAHMKGIWAAALMPFAEDLSIDEAGLPAQPAALGGRSRH
jgi:4-hydroxy-tetrahydrodipicolinate synthase